MFWVCLTGLSLAIWLYLLLGRGFYWRADQRLGVAPDPGSWPEAVAVIPARNEAQSIGAVIAAHMATDYPGAFSVVLVDDGSTDGTAALARRAALGASRRLDMVPAPPLEEGWTGKLAAMATGVARARETAPGARYILFTDADILMASDALRLLVAKAEDEDLALASLMARLDARGRWGATLIPPFIYFFQKLYPFRRANHPKSRVAAAAGGCMLVRRDALEAAGGLEPIRDRLIDDCALAALVKDPRGARRRIWLGLADGEALSLRDNRRLSSVWTMVARTAFAQLGCSTAALVGTVVAMALIYLAPVIGVIAFPLHRNETALALALAAFAAMLFSYQPTARLYRQPPWRLVLLPIAAGYYTAMTISSAVQHWRGRGGRWKGRVYPARGARLTGER